MQDLGDASLANWAINAPALFAGLLLGPAFGRVSRGAGHGEDIAELRERADLITGGRFTWPTSARQTPRPQSSDSSPLVWVFIAAVIAVSLYLKYRASILIGILCLALVISLVAMVVLVVASRRGVVASGFWHSAAFLVPLLFTAVGTTSVAFLWNPPAGGDRFRRFVSLYAESGAFESIDGFGFVLYQILGAAFFVLLATLTLLFCVANLVAIYVAIGSWGGLVWQTLHRLLCPLGSPWIVVLCIPLAVLALLLSGGWAFEWVVSTSVLRTPR